MIGVDFLVLRHIENPKDLNKIQVSVQVPNEKRKGLHVAKQTTHAAEALEDGDHLAWLDLGLLATEEVGSEPDDGILAVEGLTHVAWGVFVSMIDFSLPLRWLGVSEVLLVLRFLEYIEPICLFNNVVFPDEIIVVDVLARVQLELWVKLHVHRHCFGQAWEVALANDYKHIEKESLEEGLDIL